MKFELINLSDVKVVNRIRMEMGDMDRLSHSIESLGLLQPIVLNQRKELISGFRRCTAFETLGRTHIPAVICANLDDILSALEAERDENECRVPLTISETVALAKKIKEVEAAEAAKRKKAGKASESSGRTRDKVASAVGLSSPTLKRAEEIIEAAEEDPEKFGDLKGIMDSKGLQAAREELAERLKEDQPKPLADGYENLSPYVRRILNTHNSYTLDQLVPLGQYDHGLQDALLKAVMAKRMTLQQAIDSGVPVEKTIEEEIEDANGEIDTVIVMIRKWVDSLPPDPWVDYLGTRDGIDGKVKSVVELLKSCKCIGRCPRCNGARCKHCLNTGRVTKRRRDELNAAKQ